MKIWNSWCFFGLFGVFFAYLVFFRIWCFFGIVGVFFGVVGVFLAYLVFFWHIWCFFGVFGVLLGVLGVFGVLGVLLCVHAFCLAYLVFGLVYLAYFHHKRCADFS